MDGAARRRAPEGGLIMDRHIPRVGPPPAENGTPAELETQAGADFREHFERSDGNAGLAPAQRFIVACVKASGARVAFNAYDKRSIADSVAAQLRSVGCQTTVEAAP